MRIHFPAALLCAGALPWTWVFSPSFSPFLASHSSKLTTVMDLGERGRRESHYTQHHFRSTWVTHGLSRA